MASSLTGTVTIRMTALSTFPRSAAARHNFAFLAQRHSAWTGVGALSSIVRKGGESAGAALTQRQTSTSPAGVPPCSAPRAGPGSTPEKEKSSAFPAEDQQYLGKLFAGCVAGAGVIKYGSVLFPQITEPSLVVASIAVTAPVVASVVLLWAASSNSGPPSSDV